MKHRMMLIVLFALLCLLIAAPAYAGGWAVLTLDDLPTNVAAGETFTVGFTVRQHGDHRMTGLTPTVSARQPRTGDRVNVAAREDSEGHYAADLTLPAAGRWVWSIEAFTATHPMPDLEVSEATAVPARSTSAAPIVILALAGAAGLMTLAAARLWHVQKPRPARILAGSAFLPILVCLGLGFAAEQPAAAQAHPEPAALDGADLFLAKGCVTCHYHGDVPKAINVSIGPVLTHYDSDEAYLRVWLSDPSALKPETFMPNLDLSEDEIDALVAFLLADE